MTNNTRICYALIGDNKKRYSARTLDPVALIKMQGDLVRKYKSRLDYCKYVTDDEYEKEMKAR